jgi:5-methyltetrahydrofolate--homocysteine methyltransferase
MKASILELAARRVVLLDGAMGTQLFQKGLSPGDPPELWNADRPDEIRSVHAAYFEAGADAVLTNSFGGTPIKLASHGLEDRAGELNRAAAEIAVSARPEGRFVGGSMGPTGRFLAPQGECTESQFEQTYALQAHALAEGGVDFLLIETQYDLREALCALRAAQKTGLPVFSTLTFNSFPRGYFTIMGDGVGASLAALEKAGASAVGANCTLDSRDMAALVSEMRAATTLPLVAQANSGQPQIGDGGVTYAQSIDDYVAHIPRMTAAGANIVGGCCGTDPDTIRRMAEILRIPAGGRE